jgi:mannose-6-phosphate isomerase-like protein (cupin superfamily)
MTVRRVVTIERDGKSVLLREEVAASGPIGNQDFVWRTEEAPVVPNMGEISEKTDAFPLAGGVWVMRWEVPAGVVLEGADDSNLLDFDGDRPGYHKTDSVDVDYVVSGSLVLQLDHEEVLLNAGDVVVVNGNDHAWRNPGTETTVILSVLTGAHRRG